MRHAHPEGKTYWPFDAGCSKCGHKSSIILCLYSVSGARLYKLFDTRESYPEPLKLLIPGWVEGETFHSRLLGVTVKLELDVGV